MPTLDRLRRATRYPFGTPRRLALTALVLTAVAWGSWYGVRAVRFDRAREAAEAALAAYDFPAARERLRECVRLQPSDPAVRLLAAQAARRDGDLDAAAVELAHYRKVAGRGTPEGRLEEALQRAAQGQIEEDIDYLIRLADTRHPAMEQILEALTVGCVHNYHFDRASFWLTQLLTHFPQNPVGRLTRAQMHGNLGRREQGIQACRELLADFPGHTKARAYLAGLLSKAQRYEEAIGHYEELQRQRPDDAAALLGLAQCLDRLGRVDEARPLMSELESRSPDSSEALLECGRFALKDKRAADAERLLRRAVELAPNDHEVHYYLSVCLEQLGKTEESQRHLAEFKRIEADLLRMEKLVAATIKAPRDPAPRRELGLICLRNGQVQEGLRWLYGVLELAPGDRATHDALANFYFAQGDFNRAAYHRRGQ